MNPKSRLIGILLALAVVQGTLLNALVRPRYAKDFAPVSQGKVGNLPAELLFLQFFGFREFLAGILWVRADSFFDSGNYDAILPIIRLVTWLDPHYIDVYSTGMWHLGYNFTDEESRSDRRYVPFSLALGKEGTANNPETYELFFETGWIWFHKIDDNYENACKWLNQANQKKDIPPARRHLYAKALIRNGQIEEAVQWYARLLEDANKQMEDQREYSDRTMRDTIENNLDSTLVRMAQRGYFALKRKDGSYEQHPYDTRPPFDVGFSARVIIEEPAVLRVEGNWNVLPVGTRVRFVLKDADYPGDVPAGMDWDFASDVKLDPPRNLTFMQDGLFVKDRRFNRRLDMSKDPTMYPFANKTGKYVIEFYYNPRSGAEHIMDKFGFNGEGMTDKRFLNMVVRAGQRVIYARFEVTEDQIRRRGEWRDKTPVFQTKGFVPPKGVGDPGEMIAVPNVRAMDDPGM